MSREAEPVNSRVHPVSREAEPVNLLVHPVSREAEPVNLLVHPVSSRQVEPVIFHAFPARARPARA